MPTYYVFVTEQCRSDAATHGVGPEIDNLARKLEGDQGTHQLERFPAPYLTKKLGKQGRLLIEEHFRGGDVVLCFARYLIRGGSEYERFHPDPGSYYEKNQIDQRDIEAFLQKRKTEPIVTKPQLTDIEFNYLQSLSGTHYTEDGAILESYEWFERITQASKKNYLSRYWDLVESIILDPSDTSARVRTHPKNSDIRVLYRYFPEYDKTFLIAPVNAKVPTDEVELRERFRSILSQDPISEDELSRHSRRAYPNIIACDEEIWIRVQNSVEANLALSPEEESILESAMRTQEDGRRYPLFINGRPGSGKSTILQYLFSEHLAHHLALDGDRRLNCPPLYLTYSDSLLDQAKSAVENILKCGAAGATQNIRIDLEDPETRQTFDTSFQNFRSFLTGLLPEERRMYYSAGLHVDFTRFQQLWAVRSKQHPEARVRKITAELAWHAIRTYIQGMQYGPGAEVDPGYYSVEMLRDQKSLTDATFAQVYKDVWLGWYRPLCQKKGLWDDQDLAKEVLAADVDLSRYPAVFCDEAQDFTRIELELI